MKRKTKLKRLRKLAEAAFHRWIVARDKGICITCGKIGDQAGHFRHSKLDFSRTNLNCQCLRCNHYKSGELGIYAIELDKKYGAGTAERLINESWKDDNKYNREQLDEILKKYGG